MASIMRILHLFIRPKALLLQQGVQCNTQAGILKDFDIHFTQQRFVYRSQIVSRKQFYR